MEPFSFQSILWSYLRALGWAIVAAVGFSVGVAIAIKVFDWFSKDIDEWEEIKKGNWSISLIFVAIVVMIGLLIHKVI